MLALRLFTLLARILTVMICWIILMGVPLLFFEPKITKPYLGLFYALLLLTGTVVARSWGGRGLVFMVFPFVLLYTLQAGKILMESPAGSPDQLGALNFLAIYGVTWLAWRLGRALPSPSRDEGRLL